MVVLGATDETMNRTCLGQGSSLDLRGWLARLGDLLCAQFFFLFLKTFFHAFVCLFRTVVPCAEQHIQRYDAVTAVIHLEIFVVQIMDIGVAF